MTLERKYILMHFMVMGERLRDVKSGVCLKEQEKGVVVLFVASISPGKKEKPLQDWSLVEVEGHTSAVGSFRASPSFKIEAEMTPGQNFSRQGTRCS